MVGVTRIERATSCSQSKCSTRLSYTPLKNWTAVRISKSHKSGLQSDAYPFGQRQIKMVRIRGNAPRFQVYQTRVINFYTICG